MATRHQCYLATGECILTADLDRGEITRSKFDFDVVGHDARPHNFHLRVNEQPVSAVVTVTDPTEFREC